MATTQYRLRTVRTFLAGVALLGLTACAYHAPAEPTPTPLDRTIPTTVTLGAFPGIGAQAGTALLTAHVQNANGAPVSNVFVSFTTTAGSLSQTIATTEPDGHASVTLTATDTARVTVNVGALSAQTLVAAATPPPAAVPSPPPVFPAPAPPTATTVYMNIIQYARVGAVVTVSVSSPAINPLWTWTFGDGTSAQTMVFQTTHVYTATGSYDASVSAPGVGTAHALITIY